MLDRKLRQILLLIGAIMILAGCTKVETYESPNDPTFQSDRFKKGLEKLAEIDEEAGRKVIESLKDISPDLARYTIEYPYGDIYSRPQLDLRSREIVAIAALTTLGSAMPQLKAHINGGLNVGLSETEIIEIIIQTSIYSGFPTSLNAMNAAKEVFSERKIKSTRSAVHL